MTEQAALSSSSIASRGNTPPRQTNHRQRCIHPPLGKYFPQRKETKQNNTNVSLFNHQHHENELLCSRQTLMHTFQQAIMQLYLAGASTCVFSRTVFNHESQQSNNLGGGRPHMIIIASSPRCQRCLRLPYSAWEPGLLVFALGHSMQV